MVDVVKTAAKKAKAHTRYYVVKNGKKIRVPGTTTIAGVMDKPALVPWANKLGLMGIDVKGYVDDLANAGTCCHRMCELDCMGIKDPSKHDDMSEYTRDQIDLAETGYIKFLEWKEAVGLEPIGNELVLVHDELMYGGTVDIYCVLKKRNVRALIDIKTSKGVFGEHKTQVAGGYSLLLDYNKKLYDEVWILRLGRNQDEGYESIKVTQQEIVNHQKRFRICRELYEINKVCNKW